MKPIVLIGHRHSCPLHGDGEVITGSPSATVNGRSIARVGDEISCGAVIETGSANHLNEGRPVARQGDTSSHGGTLIEGDCGWLIE